MTLNHLVLVGGGHTNVLLMKTWLMKPNLMPDIPITIISKESSLVYSSMYPSAISRSIGFKQSLIDISSLANSAKISFVMSEVKDIEFNKQEIILNSRPSIQYSKIILNCGTVTKVSHELSELVRKGIACPIRPFFQSYQFIKSEDVCDLKNQLPFVITGSGLGAIEIAFALRKRWTRRKLILVCNPIKISRSFLKSLKILNIEIKEDMNFDYKKVLLCTGNSPHSWIKNNILQLDYRGRIITNKYLKAIDFSNIYAVGDCASVGINKNKSSGILAVKSSKTLTKNIINDLSNKNLTKWSPQKRGLQIVNLYNNEEPMAFVVYGKLVIGPSRLFWVLKHILDNNFLDKFKISPMSSSDNGSKISVMDCRGCAAKIPQNILNDALRNSKLKKFADFPEDASEIYRSDKEIIIQTLDGFPSILSDPWLNAKITALHACSDLWACGAKLISGQVLISIPKIDNAFQKYIFSQSLDGIRSIFDELGGEIIGGHTFESRQYSHKPYTLGVEVALSVQGVLKVGQKPWHKYGMKPGDVLLMSRPLGIGIFFAASMRNINIYESYEEIFKNLVTSQQVLIDNIHSIKEKLGFEIVNAATDITGYGFLGHLNEMIQATNSRRKKENLEDLKVVLNLNSFKAYPGILDLIKKGIRSSLFEDNFKIFDFLRHNPQEQNIYFSLDNDMNPEEVSLIKKLLFDPQTCGPLLISCNANFEKYFDSNWYKVGTVENIDN